MKAVLLAMTEDHHDNRSWRCSVLVLTFILLTLALNASAREQAALVREAYHDSNDNVLLIFTTAVVAGQILAAFFLIIIETQRGDWPDKEALIIILISHAGALFLNDYLLSMGNAHSFLPSSLFQPLIALTTIWVVTSVPTRPAILLSVAVISLGCMFMSIKSSTIIDSDRTSLICVLSTFVIILRNIVIRQLVFIENAVIRPRGKKVLITCGAVTLLVLAIVKIFASPIWIFPTFTAIITCMLSAALLYVTSQVLKTYSVLFISVFSVWAMFVEAVMLTPSDHRPDCVVLIIALALIILGHYLFIKDYIEHTASGTTSGLITTYPPKAVNTHEQYTRIEFLLFAALVMGVIFFVFQPKLSDRDLKTLSYVGLDKVIRQLLTVHIKPQPEVVEDQGQVQLP